MEVTAARFPPPQSAAEIEQMFDLARSVPFFSQMTSTEQDELIRKLLAYECYIQAVTVLQWRIENGARGELQKLDDYIAILTIWHDGCEDTGKFTETLKDCVQRVKPSFSTIRLRLVEHIVGAEQFAEQARIYKAIASSIEDLEQRVLLLERLAFLYEKKLTLTSEVDATFHLILELDPKNIRALRYQKLVQVQSGHWKEAVKTLERLVDVFPVSSFERQRAAFELAQIYLYQLNQPQMARDTLNTHCQDSRIDTSQTYAEALERMNAFEELLVYLAARESKSENREEKSRLKHKMGMISAKAGKTKEALSHFQDSVYLNPSNLMAHEALISVLADGKMNSELIVELKTLASNVKLEASGQIVAGLLEKAQQALQAKN